MTLQEIVITTAAMTLCKNVYIDLHGHIRPRKNPTSGMYQFDGQIFYRKKLNV